MMMMSRAADQHRRHFPKICSLNFALPSHYSSAASGRRVICMHIIQVARASWRRQLTQTGNELNLQRELFPVANDDDHHRMSENLLSPKTHQLEQIESDSNPVVFISRCLNSYNSSTSWKIVTGGCCWPANRLAT